MQVNQYIELRNRALSLLAYQDSALLAQIQATNAQNMTDQLSAFATVIKHNPENMLNYFMINGNTNDSLLINGLAPKY